MREEEEEEEKKKRTDRNFQPKTRKKYTRVACKLKKIENAFPQAQLNQEHTDRFRQRLVCVKASGPSPAPFAICHGTYLEQKFSSTIFAISLAIAYKDCQLR